MPPSEPREAGPLENFPDRGMVRATGSRRIDGNSIALQFDGPSTFDAWLEAIAEAKHFIHFENYIIRDDRVGRSFRNALIEKARAGVQVRVIHDWMGCWATPRSFWRPFREFGIEVRPFNPPSIRDPLAFLQRDHRKLVVVDGDLAFLGGFCVGEEWAGTDESPPWRDTGVELRGPAAAAAAKTFERVWTTVGGTLPPDLICHPEKVAHAGDSAVWLIEGLPWRSRVYRATQLMASLAKERLWITDPYFLAPGPVAEALMAAARDGVDVRILVPAHNNWPWVGSLSRGGYRNLLEAGVRIFEWTGPMIHAKTSVVDSSWCRIGSTNLNSVSLLGNWELDVGVLDPHLASQVHGLFLADLASSVEVLLPRRGGKSATGELEVDPVPWHRDDRGSERLRGGGKAPVGGRANIVADLVRAGTALGNALAGQRLLGREDRVVLWTVAITLTLLALLAGFFPAVAGWIFAVLFGWVGLVLLLRSAVQAWRARNGDEEDPSVE